MGFRALQAKLRGLSEETITAEILKIIQGDQAYAVDLNTGQLLQGKDSNGVMLDHYRSPAYADFKLSLNPAGVTDLKVTGRFHSNFFMDASKFPIGFGSKDSKTDELTAKYGKEIFGLTKDNISNLNTDILPEIQEYYRSLVQL